jgi:hypothetical protein
MVVRCTLGEHLDEWGYITHISSFYFKYDILACRIKRLKDTTIKRTISIYIIFGDKN